MLAVNTNTQALLASSSLDLAERQVNRIARGLATGSRINSASDDAAGLSIANRMQSQFKGLIVANRNIHDAAGSLQTADAAMDQISNALQRMRELAVQAANGTYSDADRSALNQEFSQLREHIDSVASQTTWNGMTLLDGSFSKTIQVGSNTGDTYSISVSSAATSDILPSIPTASAQGVSTLTLSGSGTLQTTPIYTQNYTTLVQIDTTGFTSGGTITATIQLGNGTSAASYDLYKNTVTYGGAQNRPINSLAHAYDVGPGTTTVLTYNFAASSTDKYLLGFEGNWFSGAGATNTFTYQIQVTGAAGGQGQVANLSSASNASASITAVDAALTSMNSSRVSVGSQLSALSAMGDVGTTMKIRLSQSMSTITDLEYGQATSELARYAIIKSAAASVLAQAQQLPRLALDLLQSQR